MLSSKNMDKKYEYEMLLHRALESLPKNVVVKERFEMPKGIIFHEGNTTILRNLADIADKVNRDVNHIFSYLLKELGTAGDIDGERGIFQGKILPKKVQEKIEKYVNKYVLCHECGRPDTKLVRINRTLMVKCEACGAIRPVK